MKSNQPISRGDRNPARSIDAADDVQGICIVHGQGDRLSAAHRDRAVQIDGDWPRNAAVGRRRGDADIFSDRDRIVQIEIAALLLMISPVVPRSTPVAHYPARPETHSADGNQIPSADIHRRSRRQPGSAVGAQDEVAGSALIDDPRGRVIELPQVEDSTVDIEVVGAGGCAAESRGGKAGCANAAVGER